MSTKREKPLWPVDVAEVFVDEPELVVVRSHPASGGEVWVRTGTWKEGTWAIDRDVLPETYRCGRLFQISHLYGDEDPEMDSDGKLAIACGLDSEEGRCEDDLVEFEYLDHYGFVPKPKFVLWILDGPENFRNDPS